MRLSQYIGDFQPDAQVKGFAGCNLIALICSRYSAIFNAISSFIMHRKTIKIYVNNNSIIFLEYGPPSIKGYNYILYVDRGEETIDMIIHDIKDPSYQNSKKRFIMPCANPDEALKSFSKRYKFIKSAGGLVLNEQGKVLMIHRLGMWDLPKGKIEKSEFPGNAAAREIMEECGIGKLKIIKELPSTYHIYEMNGKKILKRTYWFLMSCDDDTKPVPQIEENIDEARWMSNSRMKRINSKNTYGSILDVLTNLKK